MGRTLIVDGNNTVHRYHDVYADAKGPICYVGGLFGIVKAVRDFIAMNPDHDSAIVTVDKGLPTWRFEVCPEYKGQRASQRKTEADQLHYERYKEQCRHVRNIVMHTGCLFASAVGWEGDDVIAALAHRVMADEGVTIMSTDKDYLELVDGDRVKLWEPIKKIWAEANPFYNMERCLDPKESDNLDGVPGVGKVGASAAIQLWLRDVEATRPKAEVWPRSSMKALEDFLRWCDHGAQWGLTQAAIKKLPKEARTRVTEAMALMSEDEKTAYKVAAKVIDYKDKVRANYECTSLRHAARLCEPDLKVTMHPLDIAEFKEMARVYRIGPILEDFSSYEPIFKRMDNARHAGICRG